MESIVQSMEIDNNKREEPNKLLPSHYYMEGDRVIFTEEFHKRRGSCCGNYCRQCAVLPAHKKGNKVLKNIV